MSSNPRRTGMFSLAGWLFADLFLGLMILFMVISVGGFALPAGFFDRNTFPLAPSFAQSSPFVPSVTPSPTRQPTYTPYPTQTPRPTYTPYPTLQPTAVVGLDQVPIVVSAGSLDELAGAMDAQKKPLSGRRVGFMLVFGYSYTIGPGVSLAREATAKIKTDYPDLVAADTPAYNLMWVPDPSGGPGAVRFEFFMFRDRTK